jgi:hypothetical protein
MSLSRQKAVLCILALLLVLPAAFSFPESAHATTCGTGSNITFTDFGGGYCRGYIAGGTATSSSQNSGTGTWTVPSDWNSSNNKIEVISGGGGGDGGTGAGGGRGEAVGVCGGGQAAIFVSMPRRFSIAARAP